MAYHSSSWRLQSGESAIWERPLGLTELSFHWDAVFNRTADTLQHAEVQIDPTRLQQAFDPSNVARTWINLKNRYPLLGAQLDERDDNNVFFIVSKEILNTIRPGEILMQKISSANEAADFADRMVVGESRLSDKLLACIVIFERTDIPNYFHLLIQVTHSITDGMSNITILKTFLDELCRNSPLEFSLEDRLSLAIASEDLRPQRKYSIARRRWRKAIASVISQKRTSRMMKGGHTLPRKVSQTTPHTPAHSKSISISFPPEKSTIIINHCRQKKMTFGNVYPVLGQIALTRVLIRKYLRGDINEEEWQFRIREPMVSAGPLNLRPFLDKEWLNAGGRTNVCLSIGFFAYRLPSMPLGGRQLRPGMSMPAFESLLSKERFWRRSLLVKNQALNYIKHPLLLEFLELTAPFRVQRAITAGRQWRLESGPPKHLSDRSLTPMEQASNGLVFGNGGSSLGNIDLLQPRKYPLINGKEPSDPLLELKRSTTKLRCRPTELYLGAATSNGQLHLSVLWDGNVYENDLVEEWLQEVRNATDLYLGSKEHIQAKL